MRRYKVINPEPNKIDAHKGGAGVAHGQIKIYYLISDGSLAGWGSQIL
jgi:hypothetical protein